MLFKTEIEKIIRNEEGIADKIDQLDSLLADAAEQVENAKNDLRKKCVYCPKCEKYYVHDSWKLDKIYKIYSIKQTLEGNDWKDEELEVERLRCPAGHTFYPDVYYGNSPSEEINGIKWWKWQDIIENGFDNE